MHTCIHAYMHTCIHAYMHTCIHAYMHTCIHAYMHTCIHAYMHTCIHAYMHTCTHAHMHTCTHTHIHTYIHISYTHTYIHTYFIYTYVHLKYLKVIWNQWNQWNQCTMSLMNHGGFMVASAGSKGRGEEQRGAGPRHGWLDTSWQTNTKKCKRQGLFVFFCTSFFFRFYAYYLLCLFFFMLFSFTCNSHGLGAVLWGLLSARRRSPRRVCEWHCLFHADSTVATQNSTVTGRIELGYNSFQCAEEQTLLYSFKSPSLRHILRVSLFPTLISVVNLHVLCANEQDPQG